MRGFKTSNSLSPKILNFFVLIIYTTNINPEFFGIFFH
jgi:hypothetical protein